MAVVAYIESAMEKFERYSVGTVEGGGTSRTDNGWKVKYRRGPHEDSEHGRDPN